MITYPTVCWLFPQNVVSISRGSSFKIVEYVYMYIVYMLMNIIYICIHTVHRKWYHQILVSAVNIGIEWIK